MDNRRLGQHDHAGGKRQETDHKAPRGRGDEIRCQRPLGQAEKRGEKEDAKAPSQPSAAPIIPINSTSPKPIASRRKANRRGCA